MKALSQNKFNPRSLGGKPIVGSSVVNNPVINMNTDSKNPVMLNQRLAKAKSNLTYIGGGIFVYNKDLQSVQVIDTPRPLKYVHKNLTSDYPDFGIPQRYPKVTDFVSVPLTILPDTMLKFTLPTKFTIFSGNRDTFIGAIMVDSNNEILKTRLEVTAYTVDLIIFPLYVEKSITVTTENHSGELGITTTYNDLEQCYPSREPTRITFSSNNNGAATIYPNSIDDFDANALGRDANDIYYLFLSVDDRII